MQVSNLLSALLETLAPGSDRIDGLVRELVESALASRVRPGTGNLPPDREPEVH